MVNDTGDGFVMLGDHVASGRGLELALGPAAVASTTCHPSGHAGRSVDSPARSGSVTDCGKTTPRRTFAWLDRHRAEVGRTPDARQETSPCGGGTGSLLEGWRRTTPMTARNSPHGVAGNCARPWAAMMRVYALITSSARVRAITRLPIAPQNRWCTGSLGAPAP